MQCQSANTRHLERGATLVELLVVLTILSMLAVMAVPFAETAAQRRHELELRDTLRTVRTAIDRFHEDVRQGRIEEGADGVSENGYPESLAVLVDGFMLRTSDGQDKFVRYLRDIPRNPFEPRPRTVDDAWKLFGYTQNPDDGEWNGEDVYDLRPRTDRMGLNGTRIDDW